jgi:transposase
MEVSQACADMAVHPGTSFQIPYDEPEIAHAVEQLHTLQPTLILLEATGGHEVAGAPAAVGLPAVVINPRQDRGIARATGQLAKTDGLDAQVLAHFAQAIQPLVRAPCPMSRCRRRQRCSPADDKEIKMLTVEENRRAWRPSPSRNGCRLTSPGWNENSPARPDKNQSQGRYL